MKKARCLVIGDQICDKSKLFICFTTNSIPGEYIPTVFDNYSANRIVEGYPPINLELIDTDINEDSKFRPASYEYVDVIVLCFSLVHPITLENIEQIWYPEIKKNCPDKPIILAGLNLEKREQFKEHEQEYTDEGLEPVSTEQGTNLANKLHLRGYFEVSVYKMETMDPLFDEIVRLYYNQSPTTNEEKKDEKSCCRI